jgi:quercetin dioxygenase-like cupin family protein
VLEATVPIHSREVPHTHFWPSVFFEQTSPKNEPWKTLNIRWSQGGPAKGFPDSDHDRHNLLVEIKNIDCQPAPLEDLPATDAVKLHDPNITVVLENAYVRVLSVRIPPGGREPWHTHTWPAVVVYFSLPPSVRYSKDGTKTPKAELKQLEVRYDAEPQALHSIENLGKVVYQAYRIELKPTTKVAVTKTSSR